MSTLERRPSAPTLYAQVEARLLERLRSDFKPGQLLPTQQELAREFGLAVADKHDSQDICFVPTGRYTDVIERLKPGAAAAGIAAPRSSKRMNALAMARPPKDQSR